VSDRRVAREVAVQTLYEIAHTEEPFERALESNVERRRGNAGVRAYAERLVSTVEAHRQAIHEQLAGAIDNWSIERVAMVDRCVLEVGCAEILYFPDVPVAVVIHEAVDIARKFSTDESGPFVNGVLDRIARAVPPASPPPGRSEA
jgi:N utilization substance protein B